jgi:hypothetical protein
MEPDKFLLFAGDLLYPAGGWRDFQGEFGSLEEALKAAKEVRGGEYKYEWWEVVENGRIVDRGLTEFPNG